MYDMKWFVILNINLYIEINQIKKLSVWELDKYDYFV